MNFLLYLILCSSSYAATYVSHNYQEALHGIDYKNACITESFVKTIAPMSVCTKFEKKVIHAPHNDNSEVYDCVRTELKDLIFPREFERSVCLEMTSGRHYSGCKTYGVEKDFLPDSITINTVTDLTPEKDNFPGVDSIFNFPECI